MSPVPAEADILSEVEAGLRRDGAAFERLSAVRARTLSRDLTPDLVEAVFTPEDWRLEPLATLHRLEARFLLAGGRRLRRQVRAVEGAGVTTAEGPLPADAVILCAGWGSADWTAAAPELAALVPIKGERVRFAGVALGGPVVRTAAGYVAPSAEGAVAGATMASGATDRRTTPASEPFAALARALFPSLADQPYEAAAGVRAATADGLPLVGRSRSGVWMATGFRRNGWTLAPLAARIVAAGLAGRDAGPWAGLLRPDRFLPA
jgi:glycine oxidase